MELESVCIKYIKATDVRAAQFHLDGGNNSSSKSRGRNRCYGQEL